MTDTLTPAFVEIAKDASPETLDVLYRFTGRHLLFSSKSARLLRAGDRVAVRDLHPDRAELPGVATRRRPLDAAELWSRLRCHRRARRVPDSRLAPGARALLDQLSRHRLSPTYAYAPVLAQA